MNNSGKLYTGKDESLLPARFIYDPARNNPEHKYLDSERTYQGVPTVERTPGGLLYYAFYSGGVGEGAGNFILLYRSRERGGTDCEPLLAIEPPTPSCRVFDPCLWIDPKGRLWLFYSQNYTHIDGRGGVWAVVLDDPDGEGLFSSARRIANGVMMNKPTVLRDGGWLLPAAIWHKFLSPYNSLPEENYSNIYRSDDMGESFRLFGHSDFEKRMIDEHMTVELMDGRVMMYIRSEGGIGRAFSDDGGKTFYDNGEIRHTGPNSRFCLRRLRSGRLILVYHANTRSRENLTAFLSEDDGESFIGGLLLDERFDASYPDLTEDEEGNIYVVHDYRRTEDKEIYLSIFREEDVLAGSPVSEGSRIRLLLNRATGVARKAEY